MWPFVSIYYSCQSAYYRHANKKNINTCRSLWLRLNGKDDSLVPNAFFSRKQGVLTSWFLLLFEVFSLLSGSVTLFTLLPCWCHTVHLTVDHSWKLKRGLVSVEEQLRVSCGCELCQNRVSSQRVNYCFSTRLHARALAANHSVYLVTVRDHRVINCMCQQKVSDASALVYFKLCHIDM